MHILLSTSLLKSTRFILKFIMSAAKLHDVQSCSLLTCLPMENSRLLIIVPVGQSSTMIPSQPINTRMIAQLSGDVGCDGSCLHHASCDAGCQNIVWCAPAVALLQSAPALAHAAPIKNFSVPASAIQWQRMHHCLSESPSSPPRGCRCIPVRRIYFSHLPSVTEHAYGRLCADALICALTG